MLKKAALLIVVVLLLGFISSFVRQIYDSLQVSDRLDKEAENLVALQKENSQLKAQLQQSQTPQAIEEIARNKLDFARPGETIMVISEDEIDRLLEAQQSKPVETVPNWQGWLKLFWK